MNQTAAAIEKANGIPGLLEINRAKDYLTNPVQKRRYTTKLFAKVAPQYEKATRFLSLGRDIAWKHSLIRQIPVDTKGIILDIATGNADLAVLIGRRCSSATILGCDLSQSMLRLAKQRDDAATIGLSVQDMGNQGIKDKSVTLITGGYALRNAPDIQQTISEIRRVLKPGKPALFLEFSRSPKRLVWMVHYWILRIWGSAWGQILHNDPAVYGYLAESLSKYPDRKRLHSLFINNGFSIVHSSLRMAGLIEILEVKKQE